MGQSVLGIIGGSGLYDLPGLGRPEWRRIESPWGEPSDDILFAELDGLPLRFLPRHGRGHRLSPTHIDYRANIDALKRAGVTDLVSVSAVGSLKEELAPGQFVLVGQFIDRTFAREKSFFGEGITAHVSMAHPVSPNLAARIASAGATENVDCRNGGTYLVMEGPQFSTLAESRLYRSWGCDVIGMTNMPEAKLAREAELCYATIAMVTDYDCWHEEHGSVDVAEVLRVMGENREPQLMEVFRYFLAPVRGLIAVTLVISLIASVVELSMFSFLGSLVDRMGASDPARFVSDNVALLIFMSFVLLVLRPVFTILSRGLVNLSLAPNLSTLVRWRSYRYVLRQGLGFFQNDYAGRISQKVMQTGMAVRESVVNIVDGVWYLAVYLIGTIALLAGFDWLLILPVLGWTAAYAVVIATLVPPVRERAVAMSEANSGLTGRVVDGFTNILSVKLFAHAEREEAFGREAFERQLGAARAMNRAITTMTAALTVLNSIFIFAVAALSVWLWTTGAVSLGAVAAANALVLRLNQMSGWILRSITSLFESTGTIENGMETIARPNPMVDAPDAVPLRVRAGSVRFENVTFRYGNEADAVIDDLSLAIRPGEKVGVVGPSGAGKTTLVNLLLRFYPLAAGRILIDGQDVAEVTQDSLRAAIGMVTQDTSLLHRSVLNNISYGRPGVETIAVEQAARAARADGFIATLVDPRGRTDYAAHVGERGVKLSGGQRQRIAIARVILKDAPILLLDEATSALDSEVEAAIQESLRELMADKTVIAIAHRLSTIAAMDRLVVMNQGRIVEEGGHAELLRARGLYARLWERQSGGFLGAAEQTRRIA